MDPKYDSDKDSSEFKDWKEFKRDGESESQFEYQDSTPDAISSAKEFPDTDDQENPEKM